MKIGWRFVNGLVFGISHHYQLNFDHDDDVEETLEQKVAKARREPLIFVHLGFIQLAVSW